MSNKLVSIVIPTFARPDNLCRAIDSVLAQTYSPIEVVVVDDNGIGNPYQVETEELLAPYINEKKVVYLRHETNKNGSAARNTGSRSSHGEIIGYLDDDDVFLPNKVEEQVKRLEEAHSLNKKVAGVYCNISMKGYSSGPQQLMSDKEGNLAEALLLSEIRFNSSTIMLYRYAFDAMNGWDERFLRQQDWEFCVRFFRNYEMALACPEGHLLEKFSTPNYNTANPEKIANNMVFFLSEMKEDILKMERGREILKFRYIGVACMFLRRRQFKKAFSYVRAANSYQSLRMNDYKVIFKSIIRACLVK